MASFGYELLAALEELLEEFDDGEGSAERMATITLEHHAEVEAVIAKQRWSRTLRPKPPVSFRLKTVERDEDDWIFGRPTSVAIQAV